MRWGLNYETTKVTLELDDLIKNGVNIWDFDYDSFYKGAKKKEFEQKVIDHYRFRQIGQETVGRFKHFFKTRVRELAPYYKQLYESEALMRSIDDPFGNVDIVETIVDKSKSNSEGRYMDTPQGNVDNIEDYLTNANRGKADSERTYTYTKKGNQGVNTYAHDMKELRETFLNIDEMFINDLNVLFLGVY